MGRAKLLYVIGAMIFRQICLVLLSVCFLFTNTFADNQDQAKVDYETSEKEERGPPVNVQVVTISSSELEVSWEPPADLVPDYYRIKWFGDGIPQGDEVVNSPSYIIHDLMACTPCFITVSAVQNGIEHASDIVQGMTDSDTPPEPRNCTVDKTTSTSMTTRWLLPDTNCPVYNYSISWTWQALWSDSLTSEGVDVTGDRAFTLKNIAPYSQVSMSIQAGTEVDYGPPCVCEDVTGQSVPSAPKIVSVTEGPNYVSVSWDPPEELNGFITSYRITGSSDTGEVASATTDNTLSGYIYGLAPCRAYNITVSASTSIGFGSESDPRTIEVTGRVPLDTVRCIGEWPRNFTVEWEHSSISCLGMNYHLTWNYSVLWSDKKGSGKLDVEGDNSTYEFLDAFPYSEYNVCVAIKDISEDVCCQHVTGEDAPSKPTLTDISSFRGDVRLSWSPPAEANGVVRSYGVSWMDSDGALKSQEFHDVFEGVIEDLEACNSYSFNVTAFTNKWGEETKSKEIDVANYVDRLSCVSGGSDNIIASFQFANLKCKVSEKYTNWTVFILWNNKTLPMQSSTFQDVPGSGSETIFSLPPYSVVEVCMSIPTLEAEKACCSTTTDEAISSRPTDVLVSDITTTSVVISWAMPHDVNGDIKTWEVSVREGEDEVFSSSVPRKDMSLEVKDLTPATWYYVEVKCKNGAGISDAEQNSFRTTGDSSAGNIWMIVGISVGVLVLVAVIVGVVWARKRKGKKKEVYEGQAMDYRYPEEDQQSVSRTYSEEESIDSRL